MAVTPARGLAREGDYPLHGECLELRGRLLSLSALARISVNLPPLVTHLLEKRTGLFTFSLSLETQVTFPPDYSVAPSEEGDGSRLAGRLLHTQFVLLIT